MVETVFNESPTLHSFIMDSEIVAIDPVSGTIKSFQELSGRARKDVNLKDVRIAVCIFAFDLMYLNGEVKFQALTPWCLSTSLSAFTRSQFPATS